jgi:outer membrane protein OmpA-like peptidoglycan-associated protein
VPSLALDGNPLEAGAAVRYKATRSISVLAGGGGGLVRGIGAPTQRFFVSVGWAPDFRDDDDDGIANEKDNCPLLAEDKDGFQDEDGCPDDDNDGDLREDAIDKCPNEKEDIDGFEDEDGCPEYDNDNDGVKDADDRCPTAKEDGLSDGQFKTDGCPINMTDSDGDGVMDNVDQCPVDAEDADGFEDWDGCPEMDNDKDGIADVDDKCPICMEDNDGFDDVDGCPEIDNDGDGIMDADDKCPNEMENINGVKDDDGCPDAGEPKVSFDGERLLFKELLRFSTRTNRMRSTSRDLVNQAATIMKLHPEVTKWVILVGVKDRNQNKARGHAQAWADEMKSALVQQGLPADRLDALGAAADNERYGIVAKEKEEVNNDPEAIECPAGFVAVPREAPEGADAVESSGAAESPAEGGAAAGAADAGAADAGAAAAGAAAAGTAGAVAGGGLPEAFNAYSGVVGAVAFKRNKDKLARGADTLDKIAELMKAHPNVHLEVGAHSDGRKGPDKSRKLTQDQADTIVKYLVDKGVPTERLKAVGHGMDKPIADNGKSSGRSKNRRVELTFTVK